MMDLGDGDTSDAFSGNRENEGLAAWFFGAANFAGRQPLRAAGPCQAGRRLAMAHLVGLDASAKQTTVCVVEEAG